MSEYVARRIKELRFTHRRTQQEVADFIGVSRQAYARYESGQREPSLEILEKMCDFFSVSPMVFFRNELENPKKYMILTTGSAKYEYLFTRLDCLIQEIAIAGMNESKNGESIFVENDETKQIRELVKKQIKEINDTKTGLLSKISEMDIILSESQKYVEKYVTGVKFTEKFKEELFSKKYFMFLE
jgi:transcriptional regulator with XRE-family HTH domain